MTKPSIAIIGGGPSGCAVLNSYFRAGKLDDYNIVCFEKQDSILGLWNFSWHVGSDKHGELVPNSMYRYLWSNGPKECLEYPDYSFEQHFGKEIPSYPPRAVIYDYLKGRFNKPEIMARVRLATAVRMVKYNEENKKFNVTSCNLDTNKDAVENFDYVYVCTGHYHNPKMIHFPGFETFAGRLLHAHDFRDGSQFKDKVIVTIGSSYSAEDIASQCVKYGAKHAYLSARQKRPDAAWYTYKWPKESITLKDIVTHVEGNMVYFKDGSKIEADAIIVCTGYRHYYPFMEESLRLSGADSYYNDGLYQNIFWENNPRCMYIGGQHQWFTMPYFEIQAWYARDVVLGRIPLPKSIAEMRAHSEPWKERENNLPEEIDGIKMQSDYMKGIKEATDYGDFDCDLGAVNFKNFVKSKGGAGIMSFRNLSHTNLITKKASPAPANGVWMDKLDDTIETYLKDTVPK